MRIARHSFYLSCEHARLRVKRPAGFVVALVALLVYLPRTSQAQDAGEGDLASGKAGPAFTRSFSSAASPGFDATYYHLSLDVRIEPNYLFGRTWVEGQVVGGPMETLVLDFSSTMQVDSVLGVFGEHLDFTHASDALSIALATPVQTGAAVGVDVFYQGLPDVGGFGTFVYGQRGNGDPLVWTLSEPYGAREWWPSKDHPSDKADSVRVTVTVPRDLRVGSNGLLSSEMVSGTTATYDWRSRYPIASYLVSFAAGLYDVYEQTYVRPDSLAMEMGSARFPILHYAYRGTNVFEGSDVLTGWKRVLDVMPVFEYWFGPYPFSAEKYGHAHVTFSGGMEHQTMTSMGGSGVGLITHELAHQWFGDLITMRSWPDLWLNEGFATYAELLYWQARPDLYAGTYASELRKYYDRARLAPGTLVVQDTLSQVNLFNNTRVYAKGGIVLHMLRGILGDEAFRQTLRAYTSDPALRYGIASTADFQRAAEAASGRDLDAFFRQWVTEGTGYPVYDVSWAYTPAGSGYEVAAVVEQTQEPPLSNVPAFSMPLTIAVQTEQGERRFTVDNDERRERYAFMVDARPVDLLFDPDKLVLSTSSVRPVPIDSLDELPEEFEITRVYPNPTGRTLNVVLALPEPAHVRLALYDALGRQTIVLLEQDLPAGTHIESFHVAGFPAGRYFLRMEHGGRPVTSPVTIY